MTVLYIHWPFCTKLCNYCNFNKYINRVVRYEVMKESILREISNVFLKFPTRAVSSIYFGGGTPSLAKPALVSSVLEKVTSVCHLPKDAEITLEANPSEWDKLKAFTLAGVNRISLGIQSLNDKDLKFFNRGHNVHQAMKAIEAAERWLPGRFSMDILFGRPEQTTGSWLNELAEVLQICGDHVSLYQLTVERGTPLAHLVKQGAIVLPDEDIVAEMYTCAVKMLEESGLERYEVSNFAKPGARSQHNQAYWRGEDYIGIGPGAHSRITHEDSIMALVQIPEPIMWINKVTKYGSGTKRWDKLTKQERLEEIILTSMRTKEGLTREIFSKFVTDQSLSSFFGCSVTTRGLLDGGFLEIGDEYLRASHYGLNVADNIACKIATEINDKM